MDEKIQVYHNDGHEIIPKWRDSLASGIKNHRIVILKDSWKEKGKTYLVVPQGIDVGDVIKFKNHVTRFYLKDWVAYHETGGIVYEIARLDKCRVSQFDLDKLKKGVQGFIRGYVNKPTKK